jgi:transposase
MRQKSVPVKEPAAQVVKDIRRATRRHFSAEDKIRFVVEGLRGEDSIAELCRREGIVQNLYYRWSKDFLEEGKKRLAGDTARAATSDEVKDLRREAGALKEVVAELTLENRLLKNVWSAPSVQGSWTRQRRQLSKCIRPLASGLLLQPGHDEIRAHRSQLKRSCIGTFFDRAYDAPIDCLVILREPCEAGLYDGRMSSLVDGSGSTDDHPGDKGDLRRQRS